MRHFQVQPSAGRLVVAYWHKLYRETLLVFCKNKSYQEIYIIEIKENQRQQQHVSTVERRYHVDASLLFAGVYYVKLWQQNCEKM